MMRKKMNVTRFLAFAAGAFFCMGAQCAYAQIGPDLRPPGLTPDHPVNAYSADGRRRSLADDDWRHEAGWELNASDIVFSAAKKRQLISEAPSTIHVITDRDIAAHGWRNLAEILRHVPGVQTQTTHSQFQSVMIRGLVGTENNNSRILWLQNGVPMNDVRDSGIWLDETYPVEMIKRIEVVLGPGSALYGSGAFQGVINIFTKDPGDVNPNGEYRLTIQNDLTFKASAMAAYVSDDRDFGILGHVSGNTTQGPGLIGSYMYEEYSLLQGGISASHGETVDEYYYKNLKSNSDKHWYSVDFKLHYKGFKWNLGFTDIYAGADGSEAFPYIEVNQKKIQDAIDNNENKLDVIFDKTVPTTAAFRFNRREFYTDLIFETPIGESVTFLSLLSYRLNQYRFENYAGHSASVSEIKIYDPYTDGASYLMNTTGKSNYAPLQQKLYALAPVQWRTYDAHELIGGVVLEYHNIDSDGEFDGRTVNRQNHSKIDYLTPSVFLQDEQRFWDDRIILTLGGRFDAYKVTSDTRSLAPSWRFAFLAKWTDWMTMRLSYGHAFKEPSLYQLYANSLDAVGKTSLNPELLENVELSFLFTPTYFMKIRFDAFATFISNLIIVNFEPNAGNNAEGTEGRYVPNQNSDAQLYGFELSLDTAIGKHWNLYTHYNFLYSMVDKSANSQDDRIPDDAMHRFKIGATFMNDWLTADMALFLVGGTPKTKSAFDYRNANDGGYAVPLYAILQPQITANVGANIGLMVQGSYTFSEGMTKAPTHNFYYEKEGVPVSRYSVLFSLMYPFRNH